MFLECRFSFRGQLAVEVPKPKNVRTNTDTPLIFLEISSILSTAWTKLKHSVPNPKHRTKNQAAHPKCQTISFSTRQCSCKQVRGRWNGEAEGSELTMASRSLR